MFPSLNVLCRFQCFYNVSMQMYKNDLAKHLNLNKNEVKTRKNTWFKSDVEKSEKSVFLT